MWRIGGKDVNIFGGGTIDGNGQTWWDQRILTPDMLRPDLLLIDGLDGGSISNLNMINSPCWNNLIMNSKDVTYDNIRISGYSKNASTAYKVIDGFDTLQSDNIVVQNSHVDNNDDCIAFKPNSTNILFQNMWCNGSHGVSVGSLGQYRGEVDIVENIHVYNVTIQESSVRCLIWHCPVLLLTWSTGHRSNQGLARCCT